MGLCFLLIFISSFKRWIEWRMERTWKERKKKARKRKRRRRRGSAERKWTKCFTLFPGNLLNTWRMPSIRFHFRRRWKKKSNDWRSERVSDWRSEGMKMWWSDRLKERWRGFDDNPLSKYSFSPQQQKSAKTELRFHQKILLKSFESKSHKGDTCRVRKYLQTENKRKTRKQKTPAGRGRVE